MPCRLVPVPWSMPWCDRNRSVRRVAAIAFQVRPGEQQDADVDQEDNGHADEQWDVLGESQDADESKSEGEDDDESSYLWKGFSLVDPLATDQAVPEATLIVQRLLPIEVDVTVILRRPYACRTALGIDIQ